MSAEILTHETEIELGEQRFKVFAELEISTTKSREHYEHFGFCGSNQVSESEIELADFSVEDETGIIVTDKPLLKQIKIELLAEIERREFEILERCE